eukprot:c18021_g1_i1.p1 GENE.c18021_g1_i1~~c18021_g1_i1.p1  ORF type:complete len:572 (+),score=245.61 c18021_g1_i1:96-1811(+)
MESKSGSEAPNITPSQADGTTQASVWVMAAPGGLPLRKRFCVLTDQNILFYKEGDLQQPKGSFKLSSVSNVLHTSNSSVTIVLQNSSSWVITPCDGSDVEYKDLLQKIMLTLVKMMAVMLENDPEKVQSTLEWVNTLAQSELNRDEILLAGVLPALLKLLEGEFAKIVANTLTFLAQGSEERKMAIQYQGAVPALTKLLTGDVARAEAARALAALIHGSEKRKQLVFEDSNNVIQMLVFMLQEGDADEKDVAVWTLASIIIGSEERANAVRSHEIIHQLVDILNEETAESTQEAACVAIANLSYRSLAVAEQVRGHQGVQKLIMMLQSDNQYVADAAALAVANLTALSHQFRKDFFEAGGVAALIDLFAAQGPGASHAATVIWNLSLSKKIQTSLATQGVMNALKTSNTNLKQAHATGAMISIGMFDMDLPFSSDAPDLNEEFIAILCHRHQIDFVENTIIPNLKSNNFNNFVCVCTSESSEKLLNVSRILMKAKVILAVLSPDFSTSIECYTHLLYSMRIGRSIVSCNVVSDFVVSGWLRLFWTNSSCNVANGNTEDLVKNVGSLMSNKN